MNANNSPSLRLRLLTSAMRGLVKPRLRATPTPKEARADFNRFAKTLLPRPPYLLRQRSGGTPPLHWVRCRPASRERSGIVLYFHGGAYVAGSPATHEALAGRLAELSGRPVAMPAYRLSPEHPAPAAFDDACVVWRRLTVHGYPAEKIVLAGDSAGAGIAFALLARLCAEGEQPQGIVAFSPWVDLTFSGRSFHANSGADMMLPTDRAADVANYVCQGFPAADPRISPVNARFERPPPALIHVGRQEILHDDATRMEQLLRAGGGQVTLIERDGVPHAWPLFAGWIPEAQETLEQSAAFIRDLGSLAAGPETDPGTKRFGDVRTADTV